MVCEGCSFELGSFPISMDGPVTVAYTRGIPGSGSGGTGISGSWTLEECAIVDRYPEFLSSDDTPMTVLLTSSASGQMEAGDGSTEEPSVVGFRGRFVVPAVVEMLPPDHALVQAVESVCEGGRAR